MPEPVEHPESGTFRLAEFVEYWATEPNKTRLVRCAQNALKKWTDVTYDKVEEALGDKLERMLKPSSIQRAVVRERPNEPEALFAYLCRAVANQTIDNFRKEEARKRREQKAAELLESETSEAWPKKPDWPAISKEIGSSNLGILERRYEGASYREIAADIGISERAGLVLKRVLGLAEHFGWPRQFVAEGVDHGVVFDDVLRELERSGCAKRLCDARSGNDVLAAGYIAHVVQTRSGYWAEIASQADREFETLSDDDKPRRLGTLRKRVHDLKRQVPCFGAWFRFEA